MFDVIIRNGRVIDGSGRPGFMADIGISKGRIARVGQIGADTRAPDVINARGCCVSPGFIDCHSHSDFSVLANPRLESKIRQGITTEVVGNCGESAAPVTPDRLDLILGRNPVDGLGIQWDWLTMAQYLDKIRSQGAGLNIVPLIGHNTVRAAVMGYESRAPDTGEMDRMTALVNEAMAQGARGLSSGLIYAPGCFAGSDELVALARVVAGWGGIYATHMRSEGEHLVESVAETIDVARKTGVTVQISHHKATGEKNWGKVEQTLALMDEACDAGLNVAADQYPYTAVSTGLTSMLPQWAIEGSVLDMMARFQTPGVRQQLEKELRVRPGYFQDTRLSRCPNHPGYEGMTLEELALERKTSPLTAVLDLLVLEETHVDIVSFAMSEPDVRKVMAHPCVMFGTDGQALADYGPLSKGKPHPRSFGSFPRILGKYVREEQVIGLEEAIRKMTALPAQHLGLSGRGLIREGNWADITVFNAGTVRDRATFTHPHQYPCGIEYVLVNGACVIRPDGHTGCLPGKVL